MLKSVGKNAHNKVRARQCLDNALQYEYVQKDSGCGRKRKREREITYYMQ